MRTKAKLVVLSFLGACGSPSAHVSLAAPSAYAEVGDTPGPSIDRAMQARQVLLAPDMVASSQLHRGFLTEGQDARFDTVLELGTCYRLLGVAESTLADLDISMADENGNSIAEDDSADAYPVLGAGSDTICPRWTGPFRVRAVASVGSGAYGLQLFRTP